VFGGITITVDVLMMFVGRGVVVGVLIAHPLSWRELRVAIQEASLLTFQPF
jgi:hypothetical protein